MNSGEGSPSSNWIPQAFRNIFFISDKQTYSTNHNNNNNISNNLSDVGGVNSNTNSSLSSTASSSYPLHQQNDDLSNSPDLHKIGSAALNPQHTRDMSNTSSSLPPSAGATSRSPPCLPLPSPPVQCYQQPQLSFTATTTTSLSSSSSLSSNNSNRRQHPSSPSSANNNNHHHHYYGIDPPTLISSGSYQCLPQVVRILSFPHANQLKKCSSGVIIWFTRNLPQLFIFYTRVKLTITLPAATYLTFPFPHLH